MSMTPGEKFPHLQDVEISSLYDQNTSDIRQVTAAVGTPSSFQFPYYIGEKRRYLHVLKMREFLSWSLEYKRRNMGRLETELRASAERHKTAGQVFRRREQSLQISSNSPTMDIRLVVLSIVLVAVTGHPHRRRCPMSRYKSLSSADITAIRHLQNDHEKNMSTSGIKCYRRMMRHKPSVCDLKPSDRLILTLERVSVTADILENTTTSDVADPGYQALRTFRQLRDDLMTCKETSEFSETPSEEVRPWLHHLQHFMDVASPQCLQDAVLLSLIQLLVEDVGCWAHGK
ncbi:uncharacterized protein [Dendropsophus ebraccatus]|uniref:uncharacterized protein n=1 Tax=Dendropsophus ebraccatus TaxID=150705 RepID=UPI003831D6C3